MDGQISSSHRRACSSIRLSALRRRWYHLLFKLRASLRLLACRALNLASLRWYCSLVTVWKPWGYSSMSDHLNFAPRLPDRGPGADHHPRQAASPCVCCVGSLPSFL